MVKGTKVSSIHKIFWKNSAYDGVISQCRYYDITLSYHSAPIHYFAIWAVFEVSDVKECRCMRIRSLAFPTIMHTHAHTQLHRFREHRYFQKEVQEDPALFPMQMISAVTSLVDRKGMKPVCMRVWVCVCVRRDGNSWRSAQ